MGKICYVDFSSRRKIKMKLPYSKIIASVRPLESLLNEKVPVKAAVKLRRAATVLHPHVQDFEAVRQKILNSYAEMENGKPKVEGGIVVLKDFESAEKEFTELNNTEVDLDVETMGPETLGNIQVDARSLMTLDWLIV